MSSDDAPVEGGPNATFTGVRFCHDSVGAPLNPWPMILRYGA